MPETAYIIPGYGESHKKQKSYNKIARLFAARGIKPIHIEINWHSKKPRNFRDYVKQFLRKYKKLKSTKVYVLGFSYGAIIALLSEQRAHPDALVLCSLSPYFKEDIKTLKPSWLKFWNKNFTDSEYSFNDLAPKIRTKVFLITGSKEWSQVWRRARAAKRMIKRSSLVTARGTKHNINQKAYLRTIDKVINKL